MSSITRVTESGDTLTFDPAVATTAPLSQTPFAVVTYAVHITGGTGKFAGAIGDIKNNGEVALAGRATVFRTPARSASRTRTSVSPSSAAGSEVTG